MTDRDAYGKTEREAWENAFEGETTSNDTMGDLNAKKDETVDKAKHAMEDGKQKVDEFAHKAQDRADEGMDKAADAMDRGASMLREKGNEQGGTVGQYAGNAADAMESAGSYLREHDSAELMDQVEAYIKKNPTQSLLIAAGVGFVLARAFK